MLHRGGREFYQLAIDTTPAVTAWDASFDSGASWVAGEEIDGAWRWLVAGPDADPGTATVLTKAANPIVRVTDTPEIVIRSAPGIGLW